MHIKDVDVFYGNGETDRFFTDGVASKWFYIKALCGNTTPHAALPFSKMSVGAYSGGYPTGYGNHIPNTYGGVLKFSKELEICGFSHLHQSGTGDIQYFYNYLITSPFYKEEDAKKFYPVTYEKAEPGYYETEFNNILCKLTVTKSTAVHQYSFKEKGGKVLVDFLDNGLRDNFEERFTQKIQAEEFFKDGDMVLFKGIFSGIRLFFAVKAKSSHISLDKENMRAIFCFENDAELRISYSTLSFDKAIENISESESFSFEEIRDIALSVWEEQLSAIEIETEDSDLKTKFYSNLYHSFLKPTDMTGESILGVKGDVVSDFATFWDQYKTLFPLIMMTDYDMGEKIAKGILNISRTLNKVCCSFGLSDILPCEEQAKMLGILTLIDAYYFGLIDKEVIDECAVRELEREDFKSFLENGTFERYTHISDVSDALVDLAEITENEPFRKQILSLSENWKKAYDADGLMSKDSPYYEGDRYTYSFRLHPFMEERIALAGGKERFTKLLDDFFGFNGESIRQVTEPEAYEEIYLSNHHRFQGFNNECDMETPYAYIYADRHDRLCEIIHDCVMRSFGTGKHGLPGNNDSGGLSSLFVWNVLGIFPVCGQGIFLLGSPHIKSAKIKLLNGNTLKIHTKGLSRDNFYVDKIFFNNEEINDYKVETFDLLKGGELTFYMK